MIRFSCASLRYRAVAAEAYEQRLLARELHVRGMCEELRRHRRAVEGRELAQHFIGEGCLRRPTIEKWRTAELRTTWDVVFFECCGKTGQHPRDVPRDVALADNRDVPCLVQWWCRTRWVTRTPVASVTRSKGGSAGCRVGKGAAGRQEEVRVVRQEG